MQVMNGAVVSVVAQPVGSNVVAKLRALAQCEQRFVTTHPCTLARDCKNVFGGEVGLF